MHRIRASVVARVVSTQDWLQSDLPEEPDEGAPVLFNRMGRNLFHRAQRKRGQILERIWRFAANDEEE